MSGRRAARAAGVDVRPTDAKGRPGGKKGAATDTAPTELRPLRPSMRGWLGRGRGTSSYVQAADEWRRKNESQADFTPRELEVLDLLAQGRSNKEIAETLYISLPVVERHLTRIFRRMLPESVDGEGEPRRDNRRVLAVLEWLRRTGRLTEGG